MYKRNNTVILDQFLLIHKFVILVGSLFEFLIIFKIY